MSLFGRAQNIVINVSVIEKKSGLLPVEQPMRKVYLNSF